MKQKLKQDFVSKLKAPTCREAIAHSPHRKASPPCHVMVMDSVGLHFLFWQMSHGVIPLSITHVAEIRR